MFTIQEANALLPSVRIMWEKSSGRIGNSRAIAKRRKKLRKPRKKAAAECHMVWLTPPFDRIDLQLTELEALGVQLKDFERGLVDFPSLRDGRVVLLCWQMGEGDELEWWHDVDAGFAGRTPL